MKNIFLFCLLLFGNYSFSQNKISISELDNLISDIDNTDLSKGIDTYYSKTQKNLKQSQNGFDQLIAGVFDESSFDTKSKIKKNIDKNELLDIATDLLIKNLQLKDAAVAREKIIINIDQIRNYKTIFLVYENFKNFIKVSLRDKTKETTRTENFNKLSENLKIVENQLTFLSEEEFSEYRNADVSKQLIKGVNVYHENDVFLFPFDWNIDKNNTGGGRLEITTDYLKMRLIPVINNRKILSYQSLFYGIDALTPYIRFGNGEEMLRDSSYKYDRPFGSFQYWGRSKYRMNYNGIWKMKSDFRIGSIGKLGGQKVQDVLHRDFDLTSVHVQKWETQIANGGRLAFNIDHYFDASLFSTDGDIFNPKRRFKNESEKGKYVSKLNWLNIYSPLELHWGNQITATGLGVGISNMSLKDKSGTNFFNIPENRFSKTNTSSKKFNTFWDFTRQHLFIDASFKYRYIIHNSMLEGFGKSKTTESDGDGIKDEKESVFYLDSPKSKGEVNRHLWLFDLTLALKNKKTTFFWKLSLNTQEYNFDDKYINNLVAFANSKIPTSVVESTKYFVGDKEAESLQKKKANSTWNEMRQYYKEQGKYSIDVIEPILYNRPWYGFGTIGVNFIL